MTRRIDGDWYPGAIPDSVAIGAGAFIETSSSFSRFRGQRPSAMRLGDHASAYAGCMFDIGPDAQVQIGDWTLLNGLWIIAESQVSIGAYGLISWNVVVMDCYRAARDILTRRQQLEAFAASRDWNIFNPCRPVDTPHPVMIEDNVWIGFDCCILPGVHIGSGSIIGARSVVNTDIPPNCVAVGNPARVVRELGAEDQHHG